MRLSLLVLFSFLLVFTVSAQDQEPIVYEVYFTRFEEGEHVPYYAHVTSEGELLVEQQITTKTNDIFVSEDGSLFTFSYRKDDKESVVFVIVGRDGEGVVFPSVEHRITEEQLGSSGFLTPIITEGMLVIQSKDDGESQEYRHTWFQVLEEGSLQEVQSVEDPGLLCHSGSLQGLMLAIQCGDRIYILYNGAYQEVNLGENRNLSGFCGEMMLCTWREEGEHDFRLTRHELDVENGVVFSVVNQPYTRSHYSWPFIMNDIFVVSYDHGRFTMENLLTQEVVAEDVPASVPYLTTGNELFWVGENPSDNNLYSQSGLLISDVSSVAYIGRLP